MKMKWYYLSSWEYSVCSKSYSDWRGIAFWGVKDVENGIWWKLRLVRLK